MKNTVLAVVYIITSGFMIIPYCYSLEAPSKYQLESFNLSVKRCGLRKLDRAISGFLA